MISLHFLLGNSHKEEQKLKKNLFCFVFTENDTIYWVDMGLSTISRAKRDQTWREDVVTNGIGRVEGITVDWIAGLVITNSVSDSDALFHTSACKGPCC